MTRRDERWAIDNFSARYQVPATGTVDRIERDVIGAVWGANGYTTRDQADELGARLGLSPADRGLDLGAGRGWPGLYLADRFGCTVVCSDLPLDGLVSARATASRRGLAGRTPVVTASARDLPFRPGSFDAVVHTDVLC